MKGIVFNCSFTNRLTAAFSEIVNGLPFRKSDGFLFRKSKWLYAEVQEGLMRKQTYFLRKFFFTAFSKNPGLPYWPDVTKTNTTVLVSHVVFVPVVEGDRLFQNKTEKKITWKKFKGQLF